MSTIYRDAFNYHGERLIRVYNKKKILENRITKSSIFILNL
jgi:hypothetical protein